MKTKVSIAAGALAAAAFIGGAAWACVPGAGITLDPTTGGPGANVKVTGSTFDTQGSLVNIYWDGTSGSLVGQAQVQADRSFNFTFALPANASTGNHVVSATQLDRNGLSYNPVNQYLRVTNGTAPVTRTAPQGTAQQEQADGATTPAPVAQSAPAAQAAPRAAAVPAQAAAQPAQPGGAAPGPAVGTQASPQGPPQAPAAESQQGAAAPQPAGSQEAFRTPVPAPAPGGAGEAVSSSGGTPTWLLIPLAVLSLGFLGAGSGIYLRERKRVRVRA